MRELIDRQTAIDAVHRAIFDFFDICSDDDESPIMYNDERLLEINKAITKQMRELPSAEPESHYCRECKWSRCHINIDKQGETETYWRCLNWDGETDEEGFCHEWERRTNETY